MSTPKSYRIAVSADEAISDLNKDNGPLSRSILIHYQDGWLDDDNMPYGFYDWLCHKISSGEINQQAAASLIYRKLVFVVADEFGNAISTTGRIHQTKFGNYAHVETTHGVSSVEILLSRVVVYKNSDVREMWTRTFDGLGNTFWRLTSKTSIVRIPFPTYEVPTEILTFIDIVKAGLKEIEVAFKRVNSWVSHIDPFNGYNEIGIFAEDLSEKIKIANLAEDHDFLRHHTTCVKILGRLVEMKNALKQINDLDLISLATLETNDYMKTQTAWLSETEVNLRELGLVK